MLEFGKNVGHPGINIIHVKNKKFFNKACAANIGASYAGNEILFFCDCDIILDPEQMRDLVQQLQSREGVFATLAGVKETKVNSIGGRHVTNFGYELKIRTADGRSLRIVDQEEDADNGYRNAPGLLLVKKKDFVRINGYNANLHGWGWEDQDMISRLTLGAGLERILYGHALHISHDDSARTGNYPVKDRWTSRDQMFRQALRNYDDNNFMGTFRKDVAENKADILDAAQL